MPKVTEDYLKEKRDFILECANGILKEKPLYQITMRDIIKKGGFSQGAIYRYYRNIDEIYVDLVNKNTAHGFLEPKIDTLLSSEHPEKVIISDCIMVMGEYIGELLKSIGGKTCFELFVLYAFDKEKRDRILPKLKFRQSLDYAQRKTVGFFLQCIQKGRFRCAIPVDSIVMLTSAAIDGISQNAAISALENNTAADVSYMFQALAKAILNFLEE